jgi:hypothetical protein
LKLNKRRRRRRNKRKPEEKEPIELLSVPKIAW